MNDDDFPTVGKPDDPLAKASTRAMRTALQHSPVVRNALKNRLPFWMQPYWAKGVEEGTGRLTHTCLIARSRSDRKNGIAVVVYDDELRHPDGTQMSTKEQQQVTGPRMAQALIKLGLGWFVRKDKLPAKE